MHKSTCFVLRWVLLNALIFIFTVNMALTVMLKINYEFLSVLFITV